MSFLDTSFVVDLLREAKRRTPGLAHRKLEQLDSTPMRLSLFVVCELEAGLSLSASTKERDQFQLLCQHCEIVYPMIVLLRFTGMFSLISKAGELQLARWIF